MRQSDIFDRLMAHRPFRVFLPAYTKYKEPLLYLFFGGLTTIVSIATFAWAEYLLGLPPLAANVVSWILAVAFAYITNRTWVFDRKACRRRGIFLEIVSFTGGRLLTLGMEEIILLVGVNFLYINSLLVKVAAQVLVVIANSTM